jgi:hypothetical protein
MWLVGFRIALRVASPGRWPLEPHPPRTYLLEFEYSIYKLNLKRMLPYRILLNIRALLRYLKMIVERLF